MIKLTIQHLLDTCATGIIAPEDCRATLSQWMQEALQTGLDAQLAGKPQVAIKSLRQAMRCVPPLLRLAHRQPDVLQPIIRLLQVAQHIAKGGIELDHEYDRDPVGYLGVAISCQIHLTRIGEWQQQAEQTTASITPPATNVAPANFEDQPTATAPTPRAAPSATVSPDQIEPNPITQRARWIAQRDQRTKRKKQSA